MRGEAGDQLEGDGLGSIRISGVGGTDRGIFGNFTG
jgi:hypothetical protein